MVEIEHGHSNINFREFQQANIHLFSNHEGPHVAHRVEYETKKLQSRIQQQLTIEHPPNKNVIALKAKNQLYKRLVRKGVNHRYMQKDYLALHYFSQAIQVRPVHYEAYFEIGLTYHAMGNRTQAAINLRKALDICQQEKKATGFCKANSFSNLDNFDDLQDDIVYTHADIRKAKVYAHALRALLVQIEPTEATFSQALSEYQKSLQIDGCQAFVHMSMGYLYDAMHDYQNALEYYKRALKYGPDWSDCVLYSNIGWCYEQMEEEKEALYYYNKSVESNPDFIMGLRNRARLYASDGKYNEALADYSRMEKLNPFVPEIYTDRGDTYYFHMEQPGHALNEYHTAMLIDPKNHHAYKVLAAVHMLHDPDCSDNSSSDEDDEKTDCVSSKSDDIHSVFMTKLQAMTREEAQNEALHILNRGIKYCTDVDGLSQLYLLRSELRTRILSTSNISRQHAVIEQDKRHSELWPESSLYIRVKQALVHTMVKGKYTDIEIVTIM